LRNYDLDSHKCKEVLRCIYSLRTQCKNDVSATIINTVCREEDLWNANVLQKVRLSNLAIKIRAISECRRRFVVLLKYICVKPSIFLKSYEETIILVEL
jgi:hypothetical protein